MPQKPCDCKRVPAGFELDCEIINQAWELLGGRENGTGTDISPPAAAAPTVFPQPFKLEIVQPCDVEDPDLRPYFWDCHD